MNHPDRLTHVFAQAANVTTDGVDPAVETNPRVRRLHRADGRRLRPAVADPGRVRGLRRADLEHVGDPAELDRRASLATIAVPITIALGDHDEAITRAHTDHMAAVIPGATEVILPGASHFAMLQDPAGYTAAVRAAID